MVRFNSDIVFIDTSGQVRAVASDLTLRANESGGGHIIVGSGVSLRPENNCDALDAIDLGQLDHRWDTIYACSGNFLERPTVNGSGVLLQGEVSASGVTFLNGLAGVVDIVGVSGIDVTTSGQNILVGVDKPELENLLDLSGIAKAFIDDIDPFQSTTSTVLVDAAILPFSVPTSGLYRLFYSMQASCDAAAKTCQFVVDVVGGELPDDLSLMNVLTSFNRANEQLPFAGIQHNNLPSGNYEVFVQFRYADTGANSAQLERISLEINRLGPPSGLT